MNKCTCTQTEKNVRKGVVKKRFEHKKCSSLRLDDYDYEISFYSFQRTFPEHHKLLSQYSNSSLPLDFEMKNHQKRQLSLHILLY